MDNYYFQFDLSILITEEKHARWYTFTSNALFADMYTRQE